MRATKSVNSIVFALFSFSLTKNYVFSLILRVLRTRLTFERELYFWNFLFYDTSKNSWVCGLKDVLENILNVQ